MCTEAISSKMDLAKQLAVVLQGTVKPSTFVIFSCCVSSWTGVKYIVITQCSIHSLYIAGREAQPAVDLARTFERRRCNHREAKPEDECVKEVIGTFFVVHCWPIKQRSSHNLLYTSRSDKQAPLRSCRTVFVVTTICSSNPGYTHCSCQAECNGSWTS